MKQKGRGSGRRGRKKQKNLNRLQFKEDEKARYQEEEKARCDIALARIIPRLTRLCKLSSIGVVAEFEAHEARNRSYRRTYYTVNGLVKGAYPEDRVPTWVDEWETWSATALERLAKIKRFRIIAPKNAMEILAEAFAGMHEDL